MFSRKLKKLIYHPKAFFRDMRIIRAVTRPLSPAPAVSRRSTELIVSMTTFPPRAKFAAQTLDSILCQSLRPDRIVVWLAEDECGGQNVPAELMRYKDLNVEFHFTEKSMRSYQKLIFTIKEFPEAIIVTVDDDVIYSSTMLENLYVSYKKYPYDISCHRAHRILFDENNKPLPYKQWKMRISDRTPSFMHLATGVGGVLYPPHCLDSRFFDLEGIKKLAPTCDDLWFWAMEVLNGVKTRVVKGYNTQLEYAQGSQDLSRAGANQLHKINVEGDGNDIQFANILKAFPDIMKIISGKKIIHHRHPIDNEGKSGRVAHLAFICDKNYIIPTVVCITSLIKNKLPETVYRIHIFASSVSEEDKQILLDACKGRKIDAEIIEFDAKQFEELHDEFSSKTLSASIAALQKFKLADSLPGIDKLLYLDSDIIVRKDLAEIYQIDIDDVYAAAAFDTGIMYSAKTKQINSTSYFNSGVMLLNLRRMREDNIPHKLIEFKKQYEDKSLMDQHVFNCVLKENVKFFTNRYNLLYTNLLRAKSKYSMDRLNSLMHTDFDSVADIRKQAVIIHFSSKDKPWKFYDTPLADEWYKYFLESNVKSATLERISIKEVRNG